jgi:alkylation response protein AidB-like acyl-CoA dehydrogenase
MYGLSEEDLTIQARARTFADELIPFEEQAEAAGGYLPDDVTAGHAKRARELGLHSTSMPAELGGGGCTTLQQVLVQEQVGRVTNALGWVAATPPSWLPAVATADQIARYVRPAISGEREECYAITEEGAGSDVDAIEATAYQDEDGYVLNGVKWHVTSYNTADFAFFQARLRGGPHDGAGQEDQEQRELALVSEHEQHGQLEGEVGVVVRVDVQLDPDEQVRVGVTLRGALERVDVGARALLGDRVALLALPADRRPNVTLNLVRGGHGGQP